MLTDRGSEYCGPLSLSSKPRIPPSLVAENSGMLAKKPTMREIFGPLGWSAVFTAAAIEAQDRSLRA
jgi:hypothetical protein